MYVKELFRSIRTRLSAKFGEAEAKEMACVIFENLKGWNMTDILVKGDDEISDYIVGKADNVIDRLINKDEPIQYIFGWAHFYGMLLKVNKFTLIPRQETAQLVDIIVDENRDRRDLKVLDVCTGSGCIAVALSRNLKFADVTGIDISSEALEVAKENAKTLKCDIDFVCDDIFTIENASSPCYDIIVSNPPYIAEFEAKKMATNVLDYEPHIALFVPDNDPLKFYRRIAEYANAALCSDGELYFEINPLFADNLVSYLRKEGWRSVELIRDMYGKNRFVKAFHP